jgi:hypothetical protein
MNRLRVLGPVPFVVLLLVTASFALAQTPATAPAVAAPGVQRPAEANGTVVVPDRFLRRWDPVTVFFARPAGAPGPEDHPERVVTMTPAQPGAYTWLDASTLQFRPAEPWPPLTRVAVKADGATTTLTTLMAPPVSTIPRAGQEGLGALDAITLTFAEPLDVAALAKMLRLELRPLPGVDAAKSRFLKDDDFAIKVQERASRADNASYVLQLRAPIPLGTRVTVHYRLSLDDTAARSFAETTFATAEPFRVTAFSCGGSRLPLAPDGTKFPKEQAVGCRGPLVVEFSANPIEITPLNGRDLVRLTPAVDELSYALSGRVLQVAGKFAPDTLYRVTLAPARLYDDAGRLLEMRGPSEVYVFYPRKNAFLQWRASHGVLERFGAQTVPVEGRGDERVDLRVVPVDPLDRSFWPFPERPLEVDESPRPAGPGEEPAPVEGGDQVGQWQLVEHIQALPAAPLSRLVQLPLSRESGAATFGLDLAPHLAYLSGKGAPGTYLVGIRRLDASNTRSWMRVQVTDLTLTTVEEPYAVRFVVASLATGEPVAGATVRVEGASGGSWVTVEEGTTGADGSFAWSPPGETHIDIRRLVVEKDRDTLVLDAARPPEGFADNRWSPSYGGWLQWTQGPLGGRGPETELLGHLFTERPVYRPEEKVHIKGWLRWREAGRLRPETGAGHVLVEGPGDLVWRFPVTPTAAGGFYHEFSADELPTGVYTATFLKIINGREVRIGNVAFRMEAYRIPEFEVSLHGPDRTPLDREFTMGLTATYYAGGRVAGQPVRWRVTQFPYTWMPKGREGFRFSSDARFSGGGRFESTGELAREDVTDGEGAASLTLNPGAEPTAQPRSYVVEATVTGADDQTVTATRQVIALPPFVLGLKAPRYLDKATAVTPEVLVLGPDGEPLPGQLVTVRLLHRQWHSVLQASDFSQGKARYVTDVVDEKIHETTITSGAGPLPVRLDLPRAGVFVVEIEAADRLGRAQQVAVDLYAGGEGPVAWEKPVAKVFAVTTEKDAYEPGETAHLVFQSPFQHASALVVVEAPEGNQYTWVAVAGGTATYPLEIKSTWVPRLPVHVVLMRGRVPGAPPSPGSGIDLGRPATMASTCWIKVTEVDNRVDVSLSNPAKATPGQTIPVTVRLADPKGRPLAGEVTLWLVDAAVLALGREQRLDPLPDFITPVSSHLEFRDTRNSVFGLLPFAELPGGDAGGRGGLLERTTVRKDFVSVPYYNPELVVGADGVATVQVKLPDNLTVFKLRAKAAAGPDRFGAAGGQVAVRLPVIVQPALPRFVRPGDRFTGAAVARVVEGEGGPGAAEVKADGVTIEGAARRELSLVPNMPQRIEFAVDVPTPPYLADGSLARSSVAFTVGAERTADGARDAFEVRLPIRDDRDRVTVRLLQDLEAGTPVAIPGPKEAVRPGTLRRSVLVSDQPGLVRMAAGLDFLLSYPYGCTEQKLSRARAQVALRRFRTVLAQSGDDGAVDRAVADVLDSLPQALDGDGLAAYWPGSRGYVSLTAWVVQFLVEAREAGYRVDAKLFDTTTRALERALRSDYSRFIDGESFAERAWALVALAQAGKYNPAYAAELARKAQFLDLEASAEVLHAMARSGDASSAASKELAKKLMDGLVVRLHQGREIYGGLQDTATVRNGLILTGETRTVAEVTRALARADQANPRLQVLVDALVTLGRGDGWGSTNANAAALLALAERLQPPFAGAAARRLELRLGGQATPLDLGPDAPLASWVGTTAAPAEVVLPAGGPAGTVVLRAETSYVPAADGSTVEPSASGFVVARAALRRLVASEPPERTPYDRAGGTLRLAVGDVVEEHVQVVNPKERHYVAVVVPLAAGIEPLNPNLATAPPEARPAGSLTLAPTYVAFLDDQVGFYYDTLPAGTFDFYFRTRASTAGSFIQPPAQAEMMYDGAVRGTSAGARIEVSRMP